MAVAVVQEAESPVTTASTTWTFNFANNVTAGNVVVIMARVTTNARTPGTPVSSGSATFASVVSVGGTAVGQLRMWSAVESGSGNKTYTITIAGTLTATGVMQAWELSGADGATATSSGTSTANSTTTTTNPVCVDTGLTIPTGGIFLGVIGTTAANGVGTFTDPTNFTRDYFSNTGTGTTAIWCGHSTTAASGVTGQATITTARTVYGIGAVWSELAAGGGPFPFYTRRKMTGGLLGLRGGM